MKRFLLSTLVLLLLAVLAQCADPMAKTPVSEPGQPQDGPTAGQVENPAETAGTESANPVQKELVDTSGEFEVREDDFEATDYSRSGSASARKAR